MFGPFLGGAGAVRVNLSLDETSPEQGFANALVGPQGWGFSLDDGSVDCVLAAHVLHCVGDLVGLMRALARALKVGGYLIIVSPYASSDDAWADPRTVRALTEHTFPHFAALGFEAAHLNIVPRRDLQLGRDGIVGQRAEFEVKKRFMRNVVHQMHVVLKKG